MAGSQESPWQRKANSEEYSHIPDENEVGTTASLIAKAILELIYYPWGKKLGTDLWKEDGFATAIAGIQLEAH